MNYLQLFQKLEDLRIKGLTKTDISRLKKLNIYTLYDLFYYFPKTYDKIKSNKMITELLDGEQVVLEGMVYNIDTKYISKRVMTTAFFRNNTGIIKLIWFNNRYVGRSLKENDYLRITGKIKKSGILQIINPSYNKILIQNTLSESEKNEPVYSLTSGLKQSKINNIILNAIDKYGYLLVENIPEYFLKKYNMMSRREAIILIHNPKDEISLKKAFNRFLYEEIIILEMYIMYQRYIKELDNLGKYKIDMNKDLVKKFINNLSFELTNSQKQVISKIYNEINAGKSINRLIQGDVGSGKTIVSFVCMLYLVNNGYQVALMAPTEILARQHYENFKKDLEKIGFSDIAFLSSSIKGKKREEILKNIESGKDKIIIGTHSLIEDNVKFFKLGLIIIDEQHRFGVVQRDILRDKSILKNIIVMSATPIPRSLALTIYGDLDISIINEMPSGRKEIKTKWIKTKKEQEKMYDFIRTKLEEKMQVYVVSPLIEESEKIKAISASETYDEYKKIFKDYKIAILHGKQKNKEKEEIMKEFNLGNIDILISTTVIEVGVNVLNANIMVIRSADRFGLATLHQLRGRVGRSKKQGYCFIESFTENDITSKRLEILEKSTDGFYISEKDLEIRNSGEVFGSKQSGLSDLILVDIVKHLKEIQIIREDIKEYLIKTKGNVDNKYLFIDIKNREREVK